MSVRAVSDEFLARRVKRGDEAAFAELARRYRPLIASVSWRRVSGMEIEDLRQEALIGLFDACGQHDPARGTFAAFARVCVRSKVFSAYKQVGAGKHRVLTEALRDREQPWRTLAERAAAPPGADPARVVELRDALREHAQLARRCRVDRRRRYSDEQIARALELIAQGKTFKEAAFAVGARPGQVARWAKRAGQPRPGCRRRFTAQETREAVALVEDGASLRQAGAAIGASNATVLRWLRHAA